MRTPFSAAQNRALQTLVRLWGPTRPFVLIGAGAIHCHCPNARATEDLDIALAVTLDELPLGLDRLDGWKRHARNEHEWIGPGDVHLDVVPAGPTLTDQGYFDWPSGHRMSLGGLEHAFSHNQPLELGQGAAIPVANLTVIALLKISAYLDRGIVREQPGDLAFIIEEYIGPDDDRRWSDDIIERQVPFDLVGAFLLGRDLAQFASARDRPQVERFLAVARDDRGSTMPSLVRLAPVSWGRTEEGVLERLAHFQSGFDVGVV